MFAPRGQQDDGGENQSILGIQMSSSTFKRVTSFLPVFDWIRRYNKKDFTGDLLAGLTIGLMVVPQSMAYAQVSDLPVLIGLYAAMFGCFLYTPFGTSKDMNVGPTSVLSLLVLSSYVGNAASGSTGATATEIAAERLGQAVFLCFFAGVVQIVCGVFHLGRLLDFISPPVISAFTSGSALTIAALQIKNWTGVPVGTTFFNCLIDFFQGLHVFRWRDFLLGCTCLVALFAMRHFMGKYRREDNFILWFICIARSFFVILVATLFSASFVWGHYYPTGSSPFVCVPIIPGGSPQVPGFSASLIFSQVNNGNIGQLAVSGIIVAFVSLLEGIAVAKAYARKWNYVLRPSQELMATGIIMTFASFFSSYPVGGSFSRTAVNSEAGIRTTMGGIFSGILVLLALCFATSAFHLIPQASLAAVIIHAVTFIIDFDLFIRLYRLGQPVNPLSELPPYKRSKESESTWFAYCTDFLLCIIFGVLWTPYILFRHRHETPSPQAWWDLLTMQACFALCVSVSVEWGIGIGVGLALAISVAHGANPIAHLLQPSVDDGYTKKDKLGDGEDAEASESAASVRFIKWKPVTLSSERGAVIPYAAPQRGSVMDSDSQLAELRQSVLCVRVDGNLVFYSVNGIIDFITAVQTTNDTARLSGLTVVPLEKGNGAEAADISRETDISAAQAQTALPSILASSTVRALVLDVRAVNEADTSGSGALQYLVREWREKTPALTVYFVGTQARVRAFLQVAFQGDAGVYFFDELEAATRAAEMEAASDTRDWRTPHSPVGLQFGSSVATLVGSDGAGVEMKEQTAATPSHGISTRNLLQQASSSQLNA